MHLTIARVDEVLYDGKAYSVTVPGKDGEMTVLRGHMPLISTLKEGTISVRENRESEPKKFPIKEGVLEVTGKGAIVLL